MEYGKTSFISRVTYLIYDVMTRLSAFSHYTAVSVALLRQKSNQPLRLKCLYDLQWKFSSLKFLSQINVNIYMDNSKPFRANRIFWKSITRMPVDQSLEPKWNIPLFLIWRFEFNQVTNKSYLYINYSAVNYRVSSKKTFFDFFDSMSYKFIYLYFYCSYFSENDI